jgi:hypothetical protein
MHMQPAARDKLIVAAGNGSNGINLLLNANDGTGALGASAPYAAGPTTNDVVLADVDGKNGLDIVVGDANGNVYVLLNDSHGVFGTAKGPYATGSAVLAVAAADFNEDGAIDIATANSSTNNASILFNDGSGGSSPAPRARRRSH